MMTEILSSSDFIGKEILELQNGDLVGTIDALLIKGIPFKVTAVRYSMPNGEEKTAAIDNVTDIDQQVVVMREVLPYEEDGTCNVLVLTCADRNGHLLGKINAFSFMRDSRELTTLTISSEKAIYDIDASVIGRIGTGAVLLNKDDSELEKTVKEEYGNPDDSQKEMSAEEIFQTVGKRVSDSMSGLGQKLGERVKNLDTDNLSMEFNRFAENINGEITKLMDNVLGQFSSRKYNAYDAEVQSILRDLHNYTVEKPISDRNGDVIIIPGQIITEEKIRTVIANDKIAELYRVAVPIDEGENIE